MAEDFLDDGLMPPGAIYTARYPMAMAYAATKHAAQRRKDDAGTPYISHPVAVSVLVWQFGDNSDLAADDLEDLAIAGLLHDIAEDAGGEASLGEIRAMFGERVAQIVALASDALPAPGEAKAPWRERKEKHVATMRRPVRETCSKSLLEMNSRFPTQSRTKNRALRLSSLISR